MRSSTWPTTCRVRSGIVVVGEAPLDLYGGEIRRLDPALRRSLKPKRNQPSANPRGRCPSSRPQGPGVERASWQRYGTADALKLYHQCTKARRKWTVLSSITTFRSSGAHFFRETRLVLREIRRALREINCVLREIRRILREIKLVLKEIIH